ncbi:CobW family GTP-binding protein [Nocardia pseudobrasiliensis]|uniref:G3E family GTPase n=1 Tax=Nocardia pseudobrasiliensis TaxID=45979 RepID=A0A370IEM8_9NOCA|nr:CobW family GTP-binding protein [Nocardia pseudobrasiliensis]RDI69168.1 G3E family GTPase [Nocardia pseudobrasiliensis]
MARGIPVLIVAGFLGAGKTTLLNHLLRQRDARIGVVVNDFGAVNIDAMLVAGQVDAMVSLGNGCVCCAVDVGELDEMFERLSQPRNRIDVIVVEASGLAEPRNLIRMVLGSDNPRIHYGGLLEVVDAEHFEDSRALHPELAAHLRLADLVVLNKADRIPEPHLARLRTELTATVEPAPVYATTHGRIDPRLLFDVPRRGEPTVAEQLSFDELLAEHHHHDDDGHRHLHDDYDTVTFTSATPLDPRALVEFLEKPPPGLFRAKGPVVFAVAGEHRKFLLHMVGRHVVFEPLTARGESEQTCVVLIGAGLDAEVVTRRLEATAHTDPDPLDAQTLLGVWHYVPRDLSDSLEYADLPE